MQLVDIKEVKGRIILKSGLHIGGGDVEMKIGGTDNPVIKHPNTQEPYIPGSSIKGKVRSLLEMKSGLMVRTDGRPLKAGDLNGLEGEERRECEQILKIFGCGASDAREAGDLGPTRASFADCSLNETWRAKVRTERLALTEVKSENSIDRIRGTAKNPRFTERVPADAVFDFSVHLKILDRNEAELLDYLLVGLKLLEMDALGGSGSRGYGRIKLELADEEMRNKFESINPFENGGKRP